MQPFFRAATVALLLVTSVPASGGPFEDGIGALDSGDYQAAMAAFEQDALAGHVQAMVELATLYLSGSVGRTDRVAAATWLAKASEGGLRRCPLSLREAAARRHHRRSRTQTGCALPQIGGRGAPCGSGLRARPHVTRGNRSATRPPDGRAVPSTGRGRPSPRSRTRPRHHARIRRRRPAGPR